MNADGTVNCCHCSAAIDPDTSPRWVSGWEMRRTQGGTNALRCRQPQEKWACPHCVEAEAKGRLNQGGFEW